MIWRGAVEGGGGKKYGGCWVRVGGGGGGRRVWGVGGILGEGCVRGGVVRRVVERGRRGERGVLEGCWSVGVDVGECG